MEFIRKNKVSVSIVLLAVVVMIVSLISMNKPNTVEQVGSMIIDVNPSIELKINKDFEVEALKAKNEDAIKVLTGYVLRDDDDDVEDVVEDIVKRLIDQGYLTSEKENVIMVTGDDKLDKSILEVANKVIEQYLKTMKIEATIAAQKAELTQDDVKNADDLNISEGKFELIKQLLEDDDTLELEDLSKKDLSELYVLATTNNEDVNRYFSSVTDVEVDDDMDETDDNIDDDDNDDDDDDDDTVVNPMPAPAPTPTPTPKPATAPATTPTPSEGTQYRLSAQEVRNMVTNRFGGAIQKIEYNYNETNPLYKGEALKTGTKVVFEINARTKAFVKWDVGNDSQFNDYADKFKTPNAMTQAANLVLTKSGVAHTFLQKIEFDWDSSEPEFKGEAFSKGVKYQFEIDANSMTFNKWERSTGDETWAKQYSNVLSK
ncbi:MAG: hypothetical protein GXY98_04990 [Erysipelothrix sp.]|nr:hypothetical protein [Erysipelothrix sp.]